MKPKIMAGMAITTVILVGCATPNVLPVNQTNAIPKSVNNATQMACRTTSEVEIASLFERWNASLATGEPKQVVANYAPVSILLPTLSNKVRVSAAEKEDYFHHFLEKQPKGFINSRHILIGCNTAIDVGTYTFGFNNGKSAKARYTYTYIWDGKNWLISSHHSSVMPEG